MRLVLFSDLHLGSPFGGIAALESRSRDAQRAVLGQILKLTVDVGADALFCAGDLYEHELAEPDVGEFLRAAFSSIAPVPVYISPGNHDWFGADSLYQRVSWSPNVHIFSDEKLQPVPIEAGLTLWGGAHLGPRGAPGFLDGFRVHGDGIHLALFHGSEALGMAHEEGGDDNARFSGEQIPRCGLHHAFVGHYHEHKDAEFFTYGGNPDPLTPCESEQVDSALRGAVVVTVARDGQVERTRRRVAVTKVVQEPSAITRAATLALPQVAVKDVSDQRSDPCLEPCGE